MQKLSTEPKNKSVKKEYLPPALVDYGSIAKITAAPKAVPGPDSAAPMRKGT